MNYLIIGYGNTLRSDDGVGYKVAEKVEQWGIAGVRALPIHQLTPELAEDIANANTVIFVDAVLVTDEMPPKVTIQSIKPAQVYDDFCHTGNPRSLLALTQVLYGKFPKAYWLLIPALNVEFGEQLSPLTATAAESALETIEQIVMEGVGSRE